MRRHAIESLTRFAFGACLVIAAGPARAASPGTYSYASARQCASAGRVAAGLCATAEANSAAEFDEKSPRFPTRAACEAAARGGCSIGLSGEAGWSGKKGGVYFSPRQAGFRIRIASDRDMTVVPEGAGAFRPRSILHRDTSVDPRAGRKAREAFRAMPLRGSSGVGNALGVSEPAAPAGSLPPPVENDPNFDCAALLEPDPT